MMKETQRPCKINNTKTLHKEHKLAEACDVFLTPLFKQKNIFLVYQDNTRLLPFQTQFCPEGCDAQECISRPTQTFSVNEDTKSVSYKHICWFNHYCQEVTKQSWFLEMEEILETRQHKSVEHKWKWKVWVSLYLLFFFSFTHFISGKCEREVSSATQKLPLFLAKALGVTAAGGTSPSWELNTGKAPHPPLLSAVPCLLWAYNHILYNPQRPFKRHCPLS